MPETYEQLMAWLESYPTVRFDVRTGAEKYFNVTEVGRKEAIEISRKIAIMKIYDAVSAYLDSGSGVVVWRKPLDIEEWPLAKLLRSNPKGKYPDFTAGGRFDADPGFTSVTIKLSVFRQGAFTDFKADITGRDEFTLDVERMDANKFIEFLPSNGAVVS